MKYSNPEIPEGINSSPRHPLKELSLLLGGVLGGLLAIVILLVLLADRLAVHIPFELEVQLASRMADRLPAGGSGALPIERYLNGLAGRLAAEQALPPGISISVHYVDDGLVNAFATLGGRLFVFRGLLERLPHENAVAMVLAHEIAHIKHRHPIRSMGRGIALGLAIGMVSRTLGDAVTDRVLAGTGGFTVLKFSRDQEREADRTALHALYRLYGHVDGAEQLFKVLESAHGGGSGPVPEFFSTHPLSVQRIDQIRAFQAEHPAMADAAATALPGPFSAWLAPAVVEGAGEGR